jgi:hypothetical protein
MYRQYAKLIVGCGYPRLIMPRLFDRKGFF